MGKYTLTWTENGDEGKVEFENADAAKAAEKAVWDRPNVDGGSVELTGNDDDE